MDLVKEEKVKEVPRGIGQPDSGTVDFANIFIVSVQKDDHRKNDLIAQLYPLIVNGCIKVKDMYDSVHSGKVKEQWINNILKSDIVLILITPNLFRPPFKAIEFWKEMEQQVKDKIIIPVLCDKYAWENLSKLPDLMPLPSNRKFISEWESEGKGKDAAFVNIVEGIDRILKKK